MTDALVEKIRSLGVIVRNKEQLPYGNGSRGVLVPARDGRRAIFVPSFGSMEKEEVEYVAEVAQGQEDERIERKEVSHQRAMLEEVTQATRQAPSGERAKVAGEIIKELGG